MTAIKLPGRNEKAHTLESGEIVACALGVLGLLELMACVAHAGNTIAATTGKRYFIRNAKLTLPVLNNMSAILRLAGLFWYPYPRPATAS